MTRGNTPEAVHVTYPGGLDQSVSLDLVVVHGTKDKALEFAVDEGHKYVPVRKGESLAAAIARYRDERTKTTPAARPKPRGQVALAEPEAVEA